MENRSIKKQKKDTRYLKRAFLAALCVFAVFLVYQRFFALEVGELRELHTLSPDGIVELSTDGGVVADPEAAVKICRILREFRYEYAVDCPGYPSGGLLLAFYYSDSPRRTGRKFVISDDMSSLYVNGRMYYGKPGYFHEVMDLVISNIKISH